MVVSERILNEMERRDVSQLELSKMTGINRSVLNRIILGTRPARDEEIALIANALNISADYLLGIKPKERMDLKNLLRSGAMTYGGAKITEEDLAVLERVVGAVLDRKEQRDA